MIKLGQKISFDPWHCSTGVLGSREGDRVEGIVTYVNPKHSWFEVEYKLGNEKFKTSFHFCDVFGEKRYARLVRD